MRAHKCGDELKIRISQLSNGIHEYHFSAHAAEISLAANFATPVVVAATLDKTSGQLYLKVNINASGKFQCDRCIEEYFQSLSNHYNVFYIYDEVEACRHPPDEVQVITPDTVSLDLTEDVRQMVLLSVPLKLLCNEDCKGLCPHCGTNWNHGPCDCKDEAGDSRWRGLEGLLKH